MNDNHTQDRTPLCDYSAPAELYILGVRGRRGHSTEYRRFPSAAEAIKFAIEEIPEPLLVGVTMQIEDERFDQRALRELYSDEAFPLQRLLFSSTLDTGG